MVDASGVIVLVNAETECQFGYRRVDLVGVRIEKLVPERFRGQHPRHRLAFDARPPRAESQPTVRSLDGGAEAHHE